MIYVLTWTVTLLASLSAVGALVWAAQKGQLDELERGASVIFEDEEEEKAEEERAAGKRYNAAVRTGKPSSERDAFPAA